MAEGGTGAGGRAGGGQATLLHTPLLYTLYSIHLSYSLRNPCETTCIADTMATFIQSDFITPPLSCANRACNRTKIPKACGRRLCSTCCVRNLANKLATTTGSLLTTANMLTKYGLETHKRCRLCPWVRMPSCIPCLQSQWWKAGEAGGRLCYGP